MSGKKRGITWFAVATIIIGILIANHFVREGAVKKENERKQTQQIAVLGDSFVEICLALGLQENLAAVSYHGKDIPELAGIPHLGGPLNISEEQLAAVQADLLIIPDSEQMKARIQTTMNNDKIAKLLLKHDTFEDIITGITEIADAMGISNKGKALAKSLMSEIDVNRKPATNAPKVLLVYMANQGEGAGFQSLACIDRETFHDEILRSAGGMNAIENSKKSWPQISIEDLIRMNPDIIIDFRPDFDEDVKIVKKVWRETVPASAVRAIENDQIYVITHHHALLPSPKIIEVHRLIQKIIANYIEK